VLSLVFWSLLLLVSLKYVVLMLRADNGGEGGILSLLALVQRQTGQAASGAAACAGLAVMGTALFYCDALITPAISVLSAVEGLELLSRNVRTQFVMPVTSASSSGCSPSSATAPRRWAACSARSCWCGSARSAVLGVCAIHAPAGGAAWR
jgi:hypothetical protein